MKSLFIITGTIICLTLIVVVIGYLLPIKHVATVTVPVNALPDSVWQRLTDVSHYPVWRNDVKAVELISNDEWIEVNNYNRKLPLKILSRESGSKLKMQINGPGLPFGGNFEFTLHSEGDKTIVTINENGEIYNPVFRFAARFIIGYSATAKNYAEHLQRSFN